MSLREDLTSYYNAGNLSAVNAMVLANQLTVTRAAQLFNRPDTAAWAAAMRASGVMFYEDQVGGSNLPGTVPTDAGAGSVGAGGGANYIPGPGGAMPWIDDNPAAPGGANVGGLLPVGVQALLRNPLVLGALAIGAVLFLRRK